MQHLPKGGLAVVYDKNEMEASGYAAELANVMKEEVHLVEYYEDDPNPPVRWEDGVMLIRNAEASKQTNTSTYAVEMNYSLLCV